MDFHLGVTSGREWFTGKTNEANWYYQSMRVEIEMFKKPFKDLPVFAGARFGLGDSDGVVELADGRDLGTISGMDVGLGTVFGGKFELPERFAVHALFSYSKSLVRNVVKQNGNAGLSDCQTPFEALTNGSETTEKAIGCNFNRSLGLMSSDKIGIEVGASWSIFTVNGGFFYIHHNKSDSMLGPSEWFGGRIMVGVDLF